MDGRLEILTGDCRDILPTLPVQSVQCCVTSPPYWGLRDYGTAQWEGGEAGCDHKRFNGYTTGLAGTDEAQREAKFFKEVCGKCGARRIDSQLGLEATPEEYISKMVAVFREVWRVLRDDGTIFLNLGDSYAAGGGTYKMCNSDSPTGLNIGSGNYKLKNHDYRRAPTLDNLKPKDLCGIPWRLAFALQADGWYLRSDIIWSKCNPMPESVTDRPTKSHEYIFLLTKAERYFYDAEAIREPVSGGAHNPGERTGNGDKHATSPNGFVRDKCSYDVLPNFRNKRSVWTIPTQPYAEAHFATFPEEIPKLCILAGSKPGDTILDSFAGSGTVGKVALELGRRAVLIELNPAYIALAHERTDVTPGWF